MGWLDIYISKTELRDYSGYIGIQKKELYMSMRYSKFHIRVKKGKGLRRTTVRVETLIAELFALRLGHSLDTAEGHTAVREWLQERQMSKI